MRSIKPFVQRFIDLNLEKRKCIMQEKWNLKRHEIESFPLARVELFSFQKQMSSVLNTLWMESH